MTVPVTATSEPSLATTRRPKAANRRRPRSAYAVPLHTRVDRETNRLLTSRAIGRGISNPELLRSMVRAELRLPDCRAIERLLLESSVTNELLAFAVIEKLYDPETAADIRRAIGPRARNRTEDLLAAADAADAALALTEA